MALSPDGKTIASILCKSYDPSNNCMQSEIALRDIATRQLMSESQLGNDAPETVIRLTFSPDGKTLALGTFGGTVILWDVSKHEPSDRLTGDIGSGFSVAFSPDGKLLASGGTNGKIILWDTSTHLNIGTLDGHVKFVASIAFSPKGKILASGNGDGTIILWDVASRKPVGQFLGHTNGVSSVAFGPDENTLASGGCSKFDADHNCTEGEIILWDVPTRQPIGQPLRGHTNVVTSVALSPDGKVIASVGADGSVILWDTDPQSWVKKSCQRVGRNLTREEWNKYFPADDYRQTCNQWPPEPEVTATPIATP
jgi:WD40 repeat protein